jgi:iron complex transport system substrate-binding protein
MKITRLLALWALSACCSGTLLAAGHPQRIVSLAPSVTESLYELGAENRVIGISVYCPKGASKKEVIGTVWEPNIEKILSLAPDLVIATKEGNKRASVEKLQSLGIRVLTVGEDRDFESICDNFLKLAGAVGKEERAKQLITEASARINGVQRALLREPKVRVFWEVGAQPLFTISRHSFINDFSRYTGSSNIFSALGARYPQVSREEVLKRDPDAILLVTMGDVTGSERARWENFTQIAAVRNDRIAVIDAPEIFTPTPLTFAKGVEIVARLLHPGIFK